MKTPACLPLIGIVCATALTVVQPAAAAGSDRALSELEQQFRELPAEARRLTGPLFWLHGDESKERLEMYVDKVAEGGNGSFTTESRPHNDWLGPNWWRDLDICLTAAKRNNLQLWIFDEKWWPSQSVGGKVPPRYAAKRLEATATDVQGPKSYSQDGFAGERYIATVAGQYDAAGKVRAESLVDLKSKVRDGRLEWQVPEGKWRIMKFTHKQAPGLIQVGGSQLSVDGASKDCVDWYLRTVYQPHYDRYKADFGKTIRGYFYDEPETPGDWGTELNGVLKEWGVDWKKAYVAYKFELGGEDQVAHRYQYIDALAEAWGRTMYGGITEWCRKRGVQSIGHFMEHGNLYRDLQFSGGNMMRLQGYSSMGGIDAVFAQFVMGKRVTRDAPCWQTPKLGSSISHAYGAADDVSMVEIFGARGQDLTYPEMKWWTDHMQVSGVNFIIPHSFNPRAPHDTDCPPYFFNGGFEPRWPLYRVYADYTSRLTLLLTGGRHVCPVALLYFGQSPHFGKFIPPEQVSEALQDALYDCDWIPYDVFETKARVDGQVLRLREEAFRVLVVPPVEVIPYPALAKAKEFFDRGGVVIGHGFLPSRSATPGKTSADIAQLCNSIWGANCTTGLAVAKTSAHGGRSFLLPPEPTAAQLQQVLGHHAGIRPTLEVTKGQTDNWLHVLHRVKNKRDIFFIANQKHEGEPRPFSLRFKAEGFPEYWDAMRNEISSIPFKRSGGDADIDLVLEPNESALIVWQTVDRKLPTYRAWKSQAPARAINLNRDPTPANAPKPPELSDGATPFQGAHWVWYPEGNPADSAPAGTRYFRKQLNLPENRAIKSAQFHCTADNSLNLFINGQAAGKSDDAAEGWRNPTALNVTRWLKRGANQLAIAAVNGGNKSSPAGVLGRLVVEFETGPNVVATLDNSWKSSKEGAQGWTTETFDDSNWPAAQEVAAFGAQPWGRLGGKLTLSPATADPFYSSCSLTESDLKGAQVYLELEGVGPENAARITVNGENAGGFIGKPSRLKLTGRLHPGRNTIVVEPFSPKSASLTIYR